MEGIHGGDTWKGYMEGHIKKHIELQLFVSIHRQRQLCVVLVPASTTLDRGNPRATILAERVLLDQSCQRGQDLP